MEACKSFADATSGYMTAHQRDAALADAQRWAGKAAAQDGHWTVLVQALRDYRAAVTTTAGSAGGAGRRLTAARATIEGNCAFAAKGY